MGLRDRVLASRTEERVIGGVPWRLLRPWDSPFWRFNVGGPIHPYRQVMGTERSLGLPALFAGCKILADNAASLPIQIFTEDQNNGKPTRYFGLLVSSSSIIDRDIGFRRGGGVGLIDVGIPMPSAVRVSSSSQPGQ